MPPIPESYGPCCSCGRRDAMNIIQLVGRAPVPGTGWGCLVCDLPMDGAMAVLCQACLRNNLPIRFIVFGYVSHLQRFPYALMDKTDFQHDLDKHDGDRAYISPVWEIYPPGRGLIW